MSSDTVTPLITTHTTAQQYYGDSAAITNDQRPEEEDKCRNTTKILAFSTFLIALSVGGYFTADLLANKGESVKVQTPEDPQELSLIVEDIDINNDNDNYHHDLLQDIRPHAFYGQSYGGYYGGYNNQYYPNPYDVNQGGPPPPGGQGGQPPPQGGPPSAAGNQAGSSQSSEMKVTNCDQNYDYSDDKETYQNDIRAVANYLKTYWDSYEQLITADIKEFTNGGLIDLECLQKKFEGGEVLCKEQTCVYDGDCVWKTDWDSIGICKYFYFDIGTLRHQERPDRRACIASMLVGQWSESCWTYEGVPGQMSKSTFKWWKQIFTVSDDWEIDDCPCGL